MKKKMIPRSDGLRATLSRRSLSNFFTIARFGPDTIFVFAVLSAMTGALYYAGLPYLSIPVFLTLMVLFFVESVETISLSRAEYKQIIGTRCLVIRSASTERRGIVKLIDSKGKLDQELWSTELSQNPVMEGTVAIVTGMNSAILEIA